jgi:uncharacterized protein (TIGR02246 family)
MDAEGQIRRLLGTYERSLNESDAALAASCYSDDGVFMPTSLPTAAGPQVLPAYVETFAKIRLDVRFAIDELVVANENMAYALTRSSGVQTTLATGEQSRESNREVFIFARREDAWKISRYLFNKPE